MWHKFLRKPAAKARGTRNFVLLFSCFKSVKWCKTVKFANILFFGCGTNTFPYVILYEESKNLYLTVITPFLRNYELSFYGKLFDRLNKNEKS
jgi:hypothetical protein